MANNLRMDLEGFGGGEGSCAGFEGERAGEGVRLAGEQTQAVAVEDECAGRLEALGEAAYDGVPVIGDRRCNVAEDVKSVRETVGGGAKFDQPGTSEGMEIETDSDEMSLKLFQVVEAHTLLQ
ncbi:hypothetical protein R6Q59_020108 [Mikania micrantha]